MMGDSRSGYHRMCGISTHEMDQNKMDQNKMDQYSAVSNSIDLVRISPWRPVRDAAGGCVRGEFGVCGRPRWTQAKARPGGPDTGILLGSERPL